MQYVRYAVEGPSDEPVAEKLLHSVGLKPHRTLTAHGKGNLDKKLPGLTRVWRVGDPRFGQGLQRTLHTRPEIEIAGGAMPAEGCAFDWRSEPPRLGY